MQLDRALLPNLAKVPAHLDFDETGHVVPFDHGYVTIIYDSRVLSEDELPRTLEDLDGSALSRAAHRHRPADVVGGPRVS